MIMCTFFGIIRSKENVLFMIIDYQFEGCRVFALPGWSSVSWPGKLRVANFLGQMFSAYILDVFCCFEFVNYS